MQYTVLIIEAHIASNRIKYYVCKLVFIIIPQLLSCYYYRIYVFFRNIISKITMKSKHSNLCTVYICIYWVWE